MNCDFQPFQVDDLHLLHDWFQEPTIRVLYAQNRVWTLSEIREKYLPRILGQEKISSFIIQLNNKPIGLIQYYALTDYLPEGIEDDSHLFLKQARNTCVGLDIFIVDASIRGKNFTPQILNAFIQKHCAEFELILVDPAITNQQAIYCYTKAGFLRTEYSMDKEHVILIKTRMNQSIQLDLLAHHPDVISQLASIWLDVLGKVWLPQIDLEQVEIKFATHLNEHNLPLTVTAFDGGKPIGCASLRMTDGIQPELSPWLASLVVDKAYQGRHIGRLLIDAIKQKARYLGFNRLYLLTFDPTLPDFYQKLGFEYLGQDRLLDLPVAVMVEADLT